MSPIAALRAPESKIFGPQPAHSPHALHPPIADPNHLKYELIDIIENNRFTIVFQPIIDLRTGDIHAHEALCRLQDNSAFETIESIFQTARQYHLTPLVEKACRRSAIELARRQNPRQLIAINVCPSILMTVDPEKNRPCLFEELYEVRDQVILELTEKYHIQDYDRLSEIVDFYRNAGFKIALDDLGAGFTRLKLLAKIQPSLIKVDRFLIADIHNSTQKQMLLESIVAFCRKIGTLVVAEGVENEDELRTVMKLKVDMAQGFYLRPPVPEFSECLPEVKAFIRHTRQILQAPAGKGEQGNEIGALINFVSPVEPCEIVENAIARFHGDETLTALPVTDNLRPLGILQKDKIFYKLGQPHGYALFSNKPVTKIMENVLVFDFHTPLEAVAQMVLQRNEKSVYDAVIVVKNGAYAGIVKIYQLLSGITEQKIHLALQANPLTGLPGNNLIRQEIIHRLHQNRIFAVLYVDLDNFKPFNDNFGFSRGDQVLAFLAKTLKHTMEQLDERDGFLGHVGGDDFVIICPAWQAVSISDAVVRHFDAGIAQFHDEQSMARGYYISQDRKGRPRHYPLLSVSVAVLTTENRTFTSYGHLVTIASEVKKKVKSMTGSNYYVDQRLG